MFNVMRGVLPGGERGVLLHEIKLFDEGTRGNWPGPRRLGPPASSGGT